MLFMMFGWFFCLGNALLSLSHSGKPRNLCLPSSPTFPTLVGGSEDETFLSPLELLPSDVGGVQKSAIQSGKANSSFRVP